MSIPREWFTSTRVLLHHRVCRATPLPNRHDALVGIGQRHVLAVVLILFGTACSSTSTAPRAAVATTVSRAKPVGTTSAVRAANCSMPTRFGTDRARNEIHGTSANGQLWGLALGPGRVPPRAGDELKIVWRMTGTGPLHVVFTAPDGSHEPLVFGPEAHAAKQLSPSW